MAETPPHRGPLLVRHKPLLTHLDLLQKEVGLHKAVVHEAAWPTAVLQELGGIWPQLGVGTHQLAVMGYQGLGDLEEKATR